MKKRSFLYLLLLPFLLVGCNKGSGGKNSENVQSIDHPRKSGEIGAFNLVSPANDFSTDTGFTFTWEGASNSDYYQLEMATTLSFVSDDEDEVYVRESNISVNKFDLDYSLPKKDVFYYWRVTAVNKDHTKKCNEVGGLKLMDPIPISMNISVVANFLLFQPVL